MKVHLGGDLACGWYFLSVRTSRDGYKERPLVRFQAGVLFPPFFALCYLCLFLPCKPSALRERLQVNARMGLVALAF
jgi:hypothetical protein